MNGTLTVRQHNSLLLLRKLGKLRYRTVNLPIGVHSVVGKVRQNIRDELIKLGNLNLGRPRVIAGE